MSWDRDVYDGLRASGIDLVAHIPDSILDPLITRAEEDAEMEAIRVAREEEGIALLTGAWLAGRRGALICQSSGLANCFNVLGSHALPVGLPFVGIVSRRGSLGDHNPAQIPGGYNMPRLLDDLSVRNRLVEGSDDAREVVEMAANSTFSAEDPYVLLLERTLTGGKDDQH